MFHDIQERVDEQVVDEGREKQIFNVIPEMSIDEVAAKDIMRKRFVHKGFRHGGEAGVFVHGKGNRSLLWSDGDDDWAFGQGILEGSERPGESKDGQGVGSGSGEPGRIEEVGISLDEGIFLRVLF